MYNLKKLREHLGIKQKDVAEIFNCSQANVALIEKDYKDLTDEQITNLSKIYGEETITSYFFEDSELPTKANKKSTNDYISNEMDTLIGEQQKSISELIDLVKKLQADNSKLTDALIKQKII